MLAKNKLNSIETGNGNKSWRISYDFEGER